MKIDESIIRKYLESMVVDQLTDEYTSKGWKVSKLVKLGKHEADLVANKGKRTIIFEIKTGKYSKKEQDRLDQLSTAASKKGYEFRLVIANPPKERSIEVIGLEELFRNYFLNEMPSELDELSSSTQIDDVYDCELSSISIDEGKNIHVIGHGTVTVSLQYGPSNDDGYSSGDSFPFSFDVKLIMGSGKLVLDEIGKIDIDTRSFYE